MKVATGKRIGDNLYLHVTALASLGAENMARVARAEGLAGIGRGQAYNLVRVNLSGGDIALLHYPRFFEDPFPGLLESWLVQPEEGKVSYRTYAESLNPPILHRKELLLPADDPNRLAFVELTASAEAVGLFDDPKRIGYRRQWGHLIRERGYRVEGHQLLPLGNEEAAGEQDIPDGVSLAGWAAERQRTAMVRYGFSAPVQALARHGFLDGCYSLFDYGCGRGDDLRGLRENGIECGGWDPFYAPQEPVYAADLVNLGFVINVIEDFDERLEALTRAWSLAQTLLVVSVMLENNNTPQAQRFRDGVMTQRGTFQKYYAQGEIKAFVEEVLDQEPVAVAPGVLYVFRDKQAEQRFLVNRHRSASRAWLREPSVPVRERSQRERQDRGAERYAAHREWLDGLWAQWLGLGRKPDKAEAAESLALTEAFGTLGKALRFLEQRKRLELGDEAISRELERAATQRLDDLRVYFALDQFERRRAYIHLDPGLKRDIKHFFGDYTAARSQGMELLMQIADTEAIAQACRAAAQHGLGWLEQPTADNESSAGVVDVNAKPSSLQLDARLVERLPALLRVYVGAAAAAYGDVRHADLIKIHIDSGKLTLMRFDDFDEQPLPGMQERVKIKLREQGVDVFRYGDEFAPPFLYRKSRFLSEEHARFPDQVAFDEALDGLGLFDLSGYGPPPDRFLETLRRHRWELDGFQLRRSQTIPEPDDPCGRFLTFRDLIECGETQAATGLPNRPEQADSYNALLELAENVLDPVIDWFGMIRLTYGFCSPPLARKIPGRIDPKRDQHASHERNRRGNLICERLGAAVDFLVEDEDMREAAVWVAENTPFDRLYFYGPDKPIHVSFGPDHSRQIVEMRPIASGRLAPRVVDLRRFSGNGNA